MGWLKTFLERLANASQKEFGNDRLDCCKNDLHDQQTKQPPKK
ncbi:MAG: LDCC motif putative metal-binding protein [Bacillota bacterium]